MTLTQHPLPQEYTHKSSSFPQQHSHSILFHILFHSILFHSTSTWKTGSRGISHLRAMGASTPRSAPGSAPKRECSSPPPKKRQQIARPMCLLEKAREEGTVKRRPWSVGCEAETVKRRTCRPRTPLRESCSASIHSPPALARSARHAS